MPMKAWIIHLDDTLEDTIRTAMPGVKWTEWQPRFVQGVAAKKTKTLAKTILAYLDTQTAAISTRALKTALDLKRVPARTFTDAVTALLKMTDKWELVGRSLRPAT